MPLTIVTDEAIYEERDARVVRAATTTTSLEAVQDSSNIAKTQSTAMPNVPLSQEIGAGGSLRRQDTMGGAQAQTRSEGAPIQPNEPPLPEGHTSRSKEGRMEHTIELTVHVLDLEKDKDAQAIEILNLKIRVKKLERKRKSGISHPKRRMYRQIKSFDDDLYEEDASKQGRKSDKIYTATTGVNTVGEGVSTAEPRTPPTTTVFDDEDVTMAMAQTLIKMKEEKAKEKGVAIKEVEDSSRPPRSITTLQPLPTINPKDKGKGVLVEQEPEKPEKVKRRDQGLAQIDADAELAQRLHKEEMAELDRTQKERQRKEEATSAALTEIFNEVQASINADALFAAKLQQEER
ncbi:hypothetical protein Tco_0336526 [Tanacetum coccineum]